MRSKVMSPLPQSVTHGLITCIGNKRRLLEPLGELFAPRLRSSGVTTFLDPFCGSGGVSRLARHLGFTVAANDWEPYAFVATSPYLENGKGEIDSLFAEFGGSATFFDDLNSRRTPLEPYIARHYAPECTERPRAGRERLFYTRENALAIDAIRERIDELLPPGDPRERARRAALAPLLHAVSVHANTSGVFKAYHRGFGGLGGDALSRILRPIRLEPPRVPRGPRGSVACGDATHFVAGRGADLCYLDPPYAGHQYGSNYFMLNTIVKWDRFPVDDRRDGDGRLIAKAGIRADWTATRSDFCSRPRAAAAMRSLLDAVDAATIVVSYSSDGIVALDELAELLSEHGSLSIRTLDYATYRGGRQSIRRRHRNSELIFVVERSGRRATVARTGARGERARTRGERSRRGVVPDEARRVLTESAIAGLATRRFHPDRLATRFPVVAHGDGRVSVALAPGWEAAIADACELNLPAPPSALGLDQITAVREALEAAVVRDHAEELDLLVRLVWETGVTPRRRDAIIASLRSFAHRPYRREFAAAVALIGRAALMRPGRFASLIPARDEIVARAAKRFGFPRGG